MQKLVKETLKAVDLVPDGYAGEAASLLTRISQGLTSTTQFLGELRNKEGGLGHGKVANAAQLGVIQAVFAARAADTVVHVAPRVHAQNHTRSATAFALGQQRF